MSPADAIDIRSFSSDADYEACLALQMAVWGEDMRECVPPRIQKISQQVGSVAAGAFDGQRLVGFVWGLTGVRGGRLAHWSHMLGVLPEARDGSLGRRLKLFQRQELLAIGVEAVYWTFDPLESRNAHLNFNRLGVEVEKYVQDYYGSGAGSHLHSGLGTDRFIVAWHLESEKTTRALADGLPGDIAGYERAPVANSLLSDDGRPVPVETDLPSVPMLRIEVPARIQDVKAADPEAGAAWRRSTRRAFEASLARGLRIEAFYRSPPSGRSFYVAC